MIDQLVLAENYSISELCRALEVSRSGFAAWRSEEESWRAATDRELAPQVEHVFLHHKRRYGARRIAVELSRQGIACGVARVARLMKLRGLKAIQPKSFQPRTTQSRHRLGYSPNLLIGRTFPSQMNQVWVGDITYIPVGTRIGKNRFGYMAILMDLYSRRIVGWDYQAHMEEDLVLTALKRAIRSRQPAVGLIVHTDRGGQYASKRYRNTLRRSGIQQSMNAAATCYDNSFMESCFGTVKTELEMVEYRTHGEAVRELTEYVHYYNQERLHSSLGYASPAEFERKPNLLK